MPINQVYKLKSYAAWLTADKKRFMLRPNSSIETWSNDLGLFSTKEIAEKFMQQKVAEDVQDELTAYIGFTISKIAVDRSLKLHDNWIETSDFEARWSYDGKGKLIDESLYDDAGTVPFYGRAKPAKFKVGDIVLVYSHGYMRPSLVVSEPPSAKWWKTHIKDGGGGDASDDAYTVVTVGYGHTHPSSVEVFPYPVQPTEAFERAIWQEFKDYVHDCDLPDRTIPIDRHHLKEGWANNGNKAS